MVIQHGTVVLSGLDHGLVYWAENGYLYVCCLHRIQPQLNIAGDFNRRKNF